MTDAPPKTPGVAAQVRTFFTGECKIFIASGNRMKRATWNVSFDHDDLKRLHEEAFYTSEARELPAGLKLPPHVFMLRDPTYGVAYEGFDLKDVKEGSVIEVRDPVLEGEAEAAAAEARSLQADHNVGPASYFTVDAASAFDFKRDRKKDREDVVDGGGGGGAAGGEDGTSTDADAGGDAAAAPAAAEPPKKDEALDAALLWAKTKYGWHVELPLTFKEKTWQFLDDPKSSKEARYFTAFTLFIVIVSTLTFCLETLPQYYSHDVDTSSSWFVIEAICVTIFTAEVVARVASTPDVKLYFKQVMNQIDIVAILPFYLELMVAQASIPGLSVFRVVRLVRVFRMFKVSRSSVTLFVNTMAKSSKALYMLIFFTAIATIICSSLVYYAERGTYNTELEMWMRPYLYFCDVFVDANTGPATKSTATYTLESGLSEPCVWIDPATYATSYPSVNYPSEAMFSCPYTYKRSDDCSTTYEQSPFDSIPSTFWWCLVTMTTVGYGDMYPTQALGKALAGCVMILGIIVIALPITVIGSNFALTFKRMVLEDEAAKQAAAEENEENSDDGSDDDLDGTVDEDGVYRSLDGLEGDEGIGLGEGDGDVDASFRNDVTFDDASFSEEATTMPART